MSFEFNKRLRHFKNNLALFLSENSQAKSVNNFKTLQDISKTVDDFNQEEDSAGIVPAEYYVQIEGYPTKYKKLATLIINIENYPNEATFQKDLAQTLLDILNLYERYNVTLTESLFYPMLAEARSINDFGKIEFKERSFHKLSKTYQSNSHHEPINTLALISHSRYGAAIKFEPYTGLAIEQNIAPNKLDTIFNKYFPVHKVLEFHNRAKIFVPFSGEGHRLGGTTVKNALQKNWDSKKTLISSQEKKVALFFPFSGKGYRLGGTANNQNETSSEDIQIARSDVLQFMGDDPLDENLNADNTIEMQEIKRKIFITRASSTEKSQQLSTDISYSYEINTKDHENNLSFLPFQDTGYKLKNSSNNVYKISSIIKFFKNALIGKDKEQGLPKPKLSLSKR